ncbi:hypothetical protein A2Y85_07745 [candidate division WOR-3 bacterium RBG_13_43_14]|uniref:V-type proton ATPase subunit E n=1 Tax=candidate division WOR-3 bacterium RBG_13_43_14 TaxID=1802590 RepID=A0A1F4UAV4_UNCW3|nr:MAG: hypothetical protein A2Y85_07745 [candidate division WOR-3 bacterium RBG_13_43_14]
MATNKVTEKIIKDAHQEAKAILEHHQAESEKLKQEYQAKIDKRRAGNKAEAESLEKTLTIRSIAQQRLAFSRDIISRKHKTIKNVIKETVEQLTRSKNYLEFLQSLIEQSRETDGELMLSERDIKNHGAELEKFLKVKNLKHKISATKDISGGVIIKKDQKTYLGSLEIINTLLSDEILIEAAKILFEGGSK